MKTCTKDNCERPHRARGLCSSHYNQEHAPNRHAKKLVACAWCGTEVLKGTGGGRKHGSVCSNQCRVNLTGKRQSGTVETRCKIPADHWALWYGKTSHWPRYPLADCATCESRFAPTTRDQRFCGSICSRLWHQRNRVQMQGGMTAEDWQRVTRHCAHCARSFTHASPKALYCNSTCSRQAAASRGRAANGSQWITRKRRLSIYERDAYTCWLCNDQVDMSADPKRSDWGPSLDHVIPRTLGGGDEDDNLRLAHRWCNAIRGDASAVTDDMFTAAWRGA